MTKIWVFNFSHFVISQLGVDEIDSKTQKHPITPFEDDPTIVDCGIVEDQAQLDTTIYRITSASRPWQQTLSARYLDDYKKGDSVTGIYPKLVFKQYRTDLGRPKGPNNAEKPPIHFEILLRDIDSLQKIITTIKQKNKKYLDNTR